MRLRTKRAHAAARADARGDACIYGTGEVGTAKQSLEVPAYTSDTLRISTVTLARKLEKLSSPPPSQEGKKPAFVLGSLLVVPALEADFPQGSEVACYFQIYHAATNPTKGRPSISIRYDFLLKQKGEYRQVAPPRISQDQSQQVEAFAFPLVKPTETQKGWMEGEYMLSIQVTVEVSQLTVTRKIPFRVVP